MTYVSDCLPWLSTPYVVIFAAKAQKGPLTDWARKTGRANRDSSKLHAKLLAEDALPLGGDRDGAGTIVAADPAGRQAMGA